LRLIDYGIINGNPQWVISSDKKTSQLWAGHTTVPKYRKNGDTGINIYVEVRPDGTVAPILEWEQIISTVLDEILVVTSDSLSFYEKPELVPWKKTGFTTEKLFETPNTIGKFKSVRPVPVGGFVKWNWYEIHGVDSSSNTVVCIRTKEGETHDSFASNGKIFALNNTILVIEKDTIHVLSQSGKESTPAKVGRIIGIRKNWAAEQALYLVIRWKNKKITIGETWADIVSIESEEEQFFQETK
jgi:hypothetical protein